MSTGAALAASGAFGAQVRVPAGHIRLKWKTDLEKQVISVNLDRRGFLKTHESDPDWNIYWASVGTVKMIFNPESGYRLNDMQLINHYPNHFELTRKDLMVKNCKRYQREIMKELQSSGGPPGLPPYLDFVPVTYLLPADYNIFVEEFKRSPNAMWIMKPTSRSQGKGIFIINKLSQIKKWSSQSKWAQMKDKELYVVSRYVENPLLVGGKKFDLRLYVLVTSYRPLRVHQFVHGFARFCNVKYTNDMDDLDNPFIHLTNVAIQKKNDEYNSSHGGKWHVRNLRLFIESAFGLEASNKLFRDMDLLIVHSLKAVQNVMINDRHCFECYGYDILLDDDLKPWLVEVNASPSLSTSTEDDRVLKTCLLRDIYNIVAPNVPACMPEGSKFLVPPETRTQPLQNVGGFYVLFDETTETIESFTASGLRTGVSGKTDEAWREDMKRRGSALGGRGSILCGGGLGKQQEWR